MAHTLPPTTSGTLGKLSILRVLRFHILHREIKTVTASEACWRTKLLNTHKAPLPDTQ